MVGKSLPFLPQYNPTVTGVSIPLHRFACSFPVLLQVIWVQATLSALGSAARAGAARHAAAPLEPSSEGESERLGDLPAPTSAVGSAQSEKKLRHFQVQLLGWRSRSKLALFGF